MLRIPKLLSVDNVIETLNSLAHNEGLGMLIAVKTLTLELRMCSAKQAVGRAFVKCWYQ